MYNFNQLCFYMLFSDDRGEEMDSSKLLEHLEIDIL